jgi:hypothetical protein
VNSQKPLIQLFYVGGVGLILPWDTGVLYSNQTGGHGCLHPEVEGLYVPLFSEGAKIEKAFEAFFTGPKWQGWCSEGIDTETADFIDAVLEKEERTKGKKDNRKYLEDSHEAWIHVTLPDSGVVPEFSPIKGFRSMDAILTWSNID